MEFIEYGNQNRPVVVLIHKSLSSDWPGSSSIKELQKKYHVVMPVLSKHIQAPDRCEKDAEAISAYLYKKYHGSIYALCGCANTWSVIKQLMRESRISTVKTVIESDETEPGKLVASILH